MSSYNARPAPNFSQFLSNLNTIPTNYEQEPMQGDDFNIDQELAMFTNANFTDFDANVNMQGGQQLNFDLGQNPRSAVEAGPDLNYEELLTSEPNPFLSNFGAPLQTALQQPTFQQTSPDPSSATSATTSASSAPGAKQQAAQKHKADGDTSVLSMEDHTRLAAEEDKRRRNTAASARFRVKKKQREQALERTVKEINDKNAQLQAKLDQLEMENKWLKGLITEKGGNEISDAYQKYRAGSESDSGEASKTTTKRKGVGTA